MLSHESISKLCLVKPVARFIVFAFAHSSIISNKKDYLFTIISQQQHSSLMQFGHSSFDLLTLHSAVKQPQSAHLICI